MKKTLRKTYKLTSRTKKLKSAMSQILSPKEQHSGIAMMQILSQNEWSGKIVTISEPKRAAVRKHVANTELKRSAVRTNRNRKQNKQKILSARKARY